MSMGISISKRLTHCHAYASLHWQILPIFTILSRSHLGSHKPIKQRPSKHKATEPSQQLIPTHPELPNRVLKV